MKKLLSVFIAALMAAALMTGCQSTAAPNASAGPADSAAATPAPSAAPEVTPASELSEEPVEEVTIRAVNWHAERDPAYELISQEIKKLHPNINFVHESITGDYYTILTTAIQSGDAPDLFTSQGSKNNYLPEYIRSGICEPLDGYFDVSNYPQIMIDRATYDGVLYMNPGAFYDTFPMYYNKTIFAENNLEPPQTYDDFINICDTLIANNVIPMSFSAKDALNVGFFGSCFTASFIPGWLQEFNAGTAVIDDPRFRSYMETVVSFGEKGYFGPDYLSIDGNGSTLLFTSGGSAMKASGSWDMGAFIGDNTDGFGSFYIPTKDGRNVINCGQDTCAGYSLYSQSPNKEEAIEVLKYLNSTESMQIIADLNQAVVALEGIEVSSPVVSSMSEFEEAIPLYLDYMAPLAVEGANPSDSVAAAIQRMIYEGISTDEAVAEIDATMDYSKRGN